MPNTATVLRPASSVFRKLHSRHLRWAMPAVLSLAATCVVSLISTLLAVGLSPALPATWLPAWGFAWIIAFPTLVIVLPHARKLVSMFVETS